MKRTHSAHTQRVCHICLNSGDLPQRHTAYDSTAVFMFIVDHKVEQVCKKSLEPMNHRLRCDDVYHKFAWPFCRVQKTHHVFPTTRQESSTDRGFFVSKKFSCAIIGNFGSSVICPPFRNMGEGDERPGPPVTDPTVTAPHR